MPKILQSRMLRAYGEVNLLNLGTGGEVKDIRLTRIHLKIGKFV